MGIAHFLRGRSSLEKAMDQTIIFGDIHANLPALEAVFADMAERGFQEHLYCLGDLVGYGTFPNEVIDFIRRREIPTIMGNYDLGVGNDSDDCGCAYRTPEARALGEQSIAWSNAHTTAVNKTFLRGLAGYIPLRLGGLNVVLVHGSPRRINEYLYADRPEASLERLLDMAEADVLVCGHTHLPYHRLLPSGRQVINAGSVGKPKDQDPRAGYVVLRAEGGALEVEFRRVAYDIERAARAIEATEMPDEFAAMLRSGTG
jgi:predicted phosphodiesterase